MATKAKKKSHLKTGKAANEEVTQVTTEMKARQEQNDRPRRFWLDKNGEDARITFLDGSLDKDGLLKKTCFYEHHVKLAGKWGNHFVCPGEDEPCPICAEGEYQKEFVAVFTIIDHRKYTANDGTIYKNQRRLFVCKTGTLEQLQKIATKKGGLVGWTIDVTRTGSKKAKVGDVLMPDKKQNLTKMSAVLGKDEVVPFDYEECFPSYSAKELEESFGFTMSSVGDEMEVEDDDFDFSDDTESKDTGSETESDDFGTDENTDTEKDEEIEF